jgi:hypothetical protein
LSDHKASPLHKDADEKGVRWEPVESMMGNTIQPRAPGTLEHSESNMQICKTKPRIVSQGLLRHDDTESLV